MRRWIHVLVLVTGLVLLSGCEEMLIEDSHGHVHEVDHALCEGHIEDIDFEALRLHVEDDNDEVFAFTGRVDQVIAKSAGFKDYLIHMTLDHHADQWSDAVYVVTSSHTEMAEEIVAEDVITFCGNPAGTQTLDDQEMPSVFMVRLMECDEEQGCVSDGHDHSH